LSFIIGAPPLQSKKSKTIMLVGATGTGKSTLVDGMVNYVLGTKWDDPFRFTVFDLEQEERDRQNNQVSFYNAYLLVYSHHQ
jgi:predicted AAA+ superfamily ATPase